MNYLTKTNMLNAIYKHKAISSKQLALLFNVKIKSVQDHILKLKKLKLIGVVPNNSRTPSYFIKTKGIKLIGGRQARPVKYVNEEHLTIEIKVLRYLVDSEQIEHINHTDFLNTYETDREIKKRRYLELGMQASKLRTPDLIVKEISGTKVYEIEITKKARYRYKEILHKLDKDYSKKKWEQIIWVINNRDNRWFNDVFGNLSIQAKTKLTFISKYETKEKEGKNG